MTSLYATSAIGGKSAPCVASVILSIRFVLWIGLVVLVILAPASPQIEYRLAGSL